MTDALYVSIANELLCVVDGEPGPQTPERNMVSCRQCTALKLSDVMPRGCAAVLSFVDDSLSGERLFMELRVAIDQKGGTADELEKGALRAWRDLVRRQRKERGIEANVEDSAIVYESTVTETSGDKRRLSSEEDPLGLFGEDSEDD